MTTSSGAPGSSASERYAGCARGSRRPSVDEPDVAPVGAAQSARRRSTDPTWPGRSRRRGRRPSGVEERPQVAHGAAYVSTLTERSGARAPRLEASRDRHPPSDRPFAHRRATRNRRLTSPPISSLPSTRAPRRAAPRSSMSAGRRIAEQQLVPPATPPAARPRRARPCRAPRVDRRLRARRPRGARRSSAWPESGSRTSARRSSSGSAPRAFRSRNAIVWQDTTNRRALRRARRRRRRGARSRPHRACRSSRTSRPRSSPGCSTQCPAHAPGRRGELAAGTIECLARMAPDRRGRRRRARLRRHERLSNAAPRHRDASTGSDELLVLFDVPPAVLPGGRPDLARRAASQ